MLVNSNLHHGQRFKMNVDNGDLIGEDVGNRVGNLIRHIDVSKSVKHSQAFLDTFGNVAFETRVFSHDHIREHFWTRQIFVCYVAQ